MSIELYPSIAKVKRNGVYQNLPGFAQQNSDVDIEAMIAEKETSSTAQYSHAEGSFFILNDVLYQADEYIPVNGTISVGENCHISILGDEIEELNDFKDASNFGYEENCLLVSSNVIARFITTTNKWSTSGKGYSYMIKKEENASKLIVTSSSNGSAVCFLKSRAFGTNIAVTTYCTGTGRIWIPANTTREFDIPADCKYINFLYLADSGTHYEPSSAVFVIDEVAEPELTNLTVDTWIGSSCIAANFPATNDIKQGDLLSAISSLWATDFIKIKSGGMLVLPMVKTGISEFERFGLCLYDKNGTPIEGRAVNAFIGASQALGDYVVWDKIYIPENAKYFRTTYWSSDRITTYNLPEFTYSFIDIPDEYKPITHELPIDIFMQNSIRRARQLTDIKWTPKVNIARYDLLDGSSLHFLDWFYADHEYVGIPYSGAGDDETHWSTIKDWGYTHYWVGQHIPIEAFITAARYPNSIMGETVNRTDPSYDSSPYGDVCTALVNYVVDGPTPLRGISNFFSTSDKAFAYIDTVSHINNNNISIGDFLYTQAHVIFISDIMRDESGNVIALEMSEETTVGNGNNSVLGTKYGGVARRKMWDINEWKQRYASYSIYRRRTFYGIYYTPSVYVDTGNEGNRDRIIDYPCIPYLGNGAIYKVGYIHNSKICIGATGFTSLVVTKDGEAFDTFDVTGLTEVSVGFSEAGYYEAYLSNGTTNTIACHWTVAA